MVNDDKGVIECTGKNVDDVFLQEYSDVIIEANSFCQDDAPILSAFFPSSNDDNSSELSNEISEVHKRRLSNRMKDRTISLGSLGQAQCSLLRLVFSGTSISHLNDSHFSNIYLEELRVVDTPTLDSIDTSAFNLSKKSLRVLELSNLKLAPREAIAYAGSFEKLEKLKLQLGVSSIDKFTFGPRFGKLVELDLSGNMMSRIGDFSFYELRHLKLLNLSNNNLHSLSHNMFTLLAPQFEWTVVKLNLLLDHNHLSVDLIDPKALTTFLRPVTLDISHNHLYSLPEKPFRTFLYSDFRNYVEVKNNAIICDSSLNWITDHVLYMNYTIGGVDEDVNPNFRSEVIGDLVFLYNREKPDFSFYKVRGVTCQDGSNLFSKTV